MEHGAREVEMDLGNRNFLFLFWTLPLGKNPSNDE